MYKRSLLSLSVLLAFNAQADTPIKTLELSHKDIQTLGLDKAQVQSKARNSSKHPLNVTESKLISNFSEALGQHAGFKPLSQIKRRAGRSLSHMTHSRYQQYHQDIPVWGAQFATHADSTNTVVKLNGTVISGLPEYFKTATLTPKSDEPQAKEAVRHLSAQKLKVDGEKIQDDDISLRLFIYTDNDKPQLVYHGESFFDDGLGTVGKHNFLLNADTLEPIRHWNDLQHADAKGPGGNEKTGRYVYGEDKAALNVSQEGNSCFMENADVITMDMNHQVRGFAPFGFTCPENNTKAINGAYSPLNDAHFFATEVVEMYQQWYSDKPWDEKLRLQVHYGESYSNAFWTGSYMGYGDGNEDNFPYTTANIVSHEIAHAMTDKFSDLEYSGQSGGINEAFSDIAGEAFEFFINGSVDWLIGGNARKAEGKAIRYFEDPAKDGRSIGHADDYYPYMNVHFSSGVFNRAFYLLANTQGWDIRKAFDVFVDANRFYWTYYSTFESGACGVINAADDRGYSAADVYEAFREVGVYCHNLPTKDADNDGMPDLWESVNGLNPNDAKDAQLDKDNDGLINLLEYQLTGNVSEPDTDNDGLLDGEEYSTYKTGITEWDSDNDNMPDGWEVQYGLDPLQYNNQDTDEDGYIDRTEYSMGTSPIDATDKPLTYSSYFQSFEEAQLPQGWSTDNGWSITTDDASEKGSQSLQSKAVQNTQAKIDWFGLFTSGHLVFDYKLPEGAEATDFKVRVQNIDSFAGQVADGQWHRGQFYFYSGVKTVSFIDASEGEHGAFLLDNVVFFAFDQDLDQDGIEDLWEYQNGLDFNNAADAALDADGDGLSNLVEHQKQTDPNNPDTDGDGLTDGEEVLEYQTNPKLADSDGDDLPDGWEIDNGQNPNSADSLDSDSDGVPDGDEFLAGTDPLNAASTPPVYQGIMFDFEDDAYRNHLKMGADDNSRWDNVIGGWTPATLPDYPNKVLEALSVDEYGRYMVSWTGYFKRGYISFDLKTRVSAWSNTFQYGSNKGSSETIYDSKDWHKRRLLVSEGYQTISLVFDVERLRDGNEGAWIDNLSFFELDYDGDKDGLPDRWESENGLNWDDDSDALLDNDNDGLNNLLEYEHSGNPFSSDTDEDGISDSDEVNLYQTRVDNAHSDSDGMPDGWEILYGLNPKSWQDYDTDGDGFSDYEEYLAGTNPLVMDSGNNPGVLSLVEESFENDPLSITLTQGDNGWAIDETIYSKGKRSLRSSAIEKGQTARVDWQANFDNGELFFDVKVDAVNGNVLEVLLDDQLIKEFYTSGDWQKVSLNIGRGTQTFSFVYHSKFNNTVYADSAFIDNLLFISDERDGDNDGIKDLWEYHNGLNYNDPTDALADPDNDGLPNVDEYIAGTKMDNADSDNDGISDGDEVNVHGTNPTRGDSDSDGIPDLWEIENGLDPNHSNSYEDTDGDGFSDRDEYQNGTSPTDAQSTPVLHDFVWQDFNDNTVPSFFGHGADAPYIWQTKLKEGSNDDYVLSSGELPSDSASLLTWYGFFKKGKLFFKAKASDSRNVSFTVEGTGSVLEIDAEQWQQYETDINEGYNRIHWLYRNFSYETVAAVEIDDVLFISHGYDGDKDGMDDLWEYEHGLDIHNADDALADTDGDGLDNLTEAKHNSNPNKVDSDDDGLSDSDEILVHGTSPISADTDEDGMSDVYEITHGLPGAVYSRNNDSDHDGISDYEEYLAGSKPNDATSTPEHLGNRLVADFEDGVIPFWMKPSSQTQHIFEVTAEYSASGKYALTTPEVENGADVGIEIAGQLPKGKIYFDYQTGIGSFSGNFNFLVNDQTPYLYNSSGEFKRFSYAIDAGQKRLEWLHRQVSYNHGKLWLDNIVFIADGYDGDGDSLPDQWEYEHGLDFTQGNQGELDSDNDGLSNAEEYFAGTHPFNRDSDEDGLTDGAEVRVYGSNPLSDDSDNDGLPDAYEAANGLSLILSNVNTDTDGDGISDYQEYISGTSPVIADTGITAINRLFETFEDGRVPEYFAVPEEAGTGWTTTDSEAAGGRYALMGEVRHPSQKAAFDIKGLFEKGRFFYKGKYEGTGISSVKVYDAASNSSSSSFYGDQWRDYEFSVSEGYHNYRWIISAYDSDQHISGRVWIDNLVFIAEGSDLDNDGMDDTWEYRNGLNIAIDDSALDADLDGLNNLAEFQNNTEVDNADTDDDGLSDGDEVLIHLTDPLRSDSDWDSMPDGWEVAYGLDPNQSSAYLDSDNDGFDDRTEYQSGTLPNDAESKPFVVGLVKADFETYQMPSFLSVPQDSDGEWSVTEQDASQGRMSLSNSNVARGETVLLKMAGYFPRGTFYFDYKAQTRQENRFRFSSGGYSSELSGEKGQWHRYSTSIYEGAKELVWQLDKVVLDGNVGHSVYLDNIIFIPENSDYDSDGMNDQWEYDNGLNFFNNGDAAGDLDNDGLSNLAEYQSHTDPTNRDSDNDGISDGDEVNNYGTNPNRVDTDGDGMPDGYEINHGLDATTASRNQDSDNDGVSDYIEYLKGTSPSDANSTPESMTRRVYNFEDNQLPGVFETADGTDATFVVQQNSTDDDVQGKYALLSDQIKSGQTAGIVWSDYFPEGVLFFDYKAKLHQSSDLNVRWSNYYSRDFNDSEQWQREKVYVYEGQQDIRFYHEQYYYNQDVSESVWLDNIVFIAKDFDGDEDGIVDIWEYENGLDFTAKADAESDLDNDGLSNLREYQLGGDPTNVDSDGDGLNDGNEADIHGTEIDNTDSDRDGLPDGWEVEHGFNPANYDGSNDSDNDGFTNLVEYQAGTNPNDATSKPDEIDNSFIHDFEDGQIPAVMHTPQTSAAAWTVNQEGANGSKMSLSVGGLSVGDKAVIEVKGYFNRSGTLYFDSRVDMASTSTFKLFKQGSDYSYVSRDGQGDWKNHYITVYQGYNVFRFEYHKVDESTANQGRVWIDNLAFISGSGDADEDQIPDHWEYTNGLDMFDAEDAMLDFDGDLLHNLNEYEVGSDIRVADSDGDGLTDGEEYYISETNTTRIDSDYDGMPDGWELYMGLNPKESSGRLDSDNDEVTNLDEYLANSNPMDNKETDSTLQFAAFDFGFPIHVMRFYNLDGYRHTRWTRTDEDSFKGQYSMMADVTDASNDAELRLVAHYTDGWLYFDYKADVGTEDRIYISGPGFYAHELPHSTQWRRSKSAISASNNTSFRVTLDKRSDNDVTTKVFVDNFIFIRQGADNDNDGMADHWEYDNGLDFNDSSDAQLDSDNDGLSNLSEYQNGTSAVMADTDGDGMTDGQEVELGLNPHDPSDGAENLDSDGDGLTNVDEIELGTDPFNADTDGDGVNDKSDVFPLDATESADSDNDGIGNNADTDDDNDGMSDEFENLYAFDPFSSADAAIDSDGDGLSNLKEFQLGLNPRDASDAAGDLDGDGFSNIEEINLGSDPLNALSIPSTIGSWITPLLEKGKSQKKRRAKQSEQYQDVSDEQKLRFPPPSMSQSAPLMD